MVCWDTSSSVAGSEVLFEEQVIVLFVNDRVTVGTVWIETIG
jgi:hypothetical protein